MKYQTMLLEKCGGITDDSTKNQCPGGMPTLAIGLGGTGIAALAEYKSRVSQLIRPDSYAHGQPQYYSIDFLAVDSDPSEFSANRWGYVFEHSEQMLISDPADFARLSFRENGLRQIITQDPLYDWFDTSYMQNQFAGPFMPGAIRQIGRFFLFRKVGPFTERLFEKLRRMSLHHYNRPIDVHIFAGLCGSFGSGTFLDLCYLLQHIQSLHHLNLNIHGHFFLPDVIEQRAQMGNVSMQVIDQLRANGYAALKELDYLMHLEENNHWFRQRYSASIFVETQKPPVDQCYLYSSRANLNMTPIPYREVLRNAADFAASYLVEHPNAANPWPTLRALLPNHMPYGAVSVQKAEIPVREMEAYLSCVLLRNMQQHRDVAEFPFHTQDIIHQLGLGAEDLFLCILQKLPALNLPEISHPVLRNHGPVSHGRLPDAWASYFQSWLDSSLQTVAAEKGRMTQDFSFSADSDIEQASLPGRLFGMLTSWLQDTGAHPACAMRLLNQMPASFEEELRNQLHICENQLTQLEVKIHEHEGHLYHTSEEYLHSFPLRRTRAYANYFETVQLWMRLIRDYEILKTVRQIIRIVLASCRTLLMDFFRPLQELVDNLAETAESNMYYLCNQFSDERNAHFVQFNTLRNQLDQRITELSEEKLRKDLISYLVQNYSRWMNQPEDIAQMWHQFVTSVFPEVLCATLNDALSYASGTAADPAGVHNAYLDSILTQQHFSAMLENLYPSRSLTIERIYVPFRLENVRNTANTFLQRYPNSSITYFSSSQRLSVLCVHCGISIRDFHGVEQWKISYQNSRDMYSGVGRHLRSAVISPQGACPEMNWYTWLPELI